MEQTYFPKIIREFDDGIEDQPMIYMDDVYA